MMTPFKKIYVQLHQLIDNVMSAAVWDDNVPICVKHDEVMNKKCMQSKLAMYKNTKQAIAAEG